MRRIDAAPDCVDRRSSIFVRKCREWFLKVVLMPSLQSSGSFMVLSFYVIFAIR